MSFSEILKKPEFSARIAELAQAAAQLAVMAAPEVLQELSKIGRANNMGVPPALPGWQ
jgi:hypothetical protein